MNDPFDSPETDSAQPENLATPSVPKLSIADLMIWTACVAIIIMYFQFLDGFTGRPPTSEFHMILRIGHAMVWGTAAAAGISWLIHWRAWLSHGKLEPGHHFIVLVLLSSSIGVVFTLVITYLINQSNEWGYQPILLVSFAYQCIAVFLVIPFLWLTRKGRWFFCLLPWVLTVCWYLLLQFSQWLTETTGFITFDNYFYLYQLGPAILSSIGLIITMVFIIVGCLGQTKRDWLHHVGVGCLLFHYFMILASGVWGIFGFSAQ